MISERGLINLNLFSFTMKSRLSNSVGLLLVVLLAGCAGSGRLRYETAEEAYQKGMEQFERARYERAAEYFQAVFNFGRSHEWADDAQLYLARSYGANKEYILAANEYTRFLEIYRNDPRAEEAEYERALTYFQRSPNFELDQSDTRRAIQFLQIFLDRYPNSEHRADVETKIEELREKLARKQFAVAELYDRRELYEAAALSYTTVFDRYPDTHWADDALLGAMRAYISFSEQSIEARQGERLQQAIDHYQRLLQVFPDSPLLKEAEALYELALARQRGLQSGSS